MFSRRDLGLLIAPLIVEQFLSVTIGIADTVMVASCGEASVSAVALVDSINQLLQRVFAALATGGAIITSQYLGREDRQGAARSAKQLVWVTFFISLGVGVVAFAFCGGIITGIYGSLEPLVFGHAKSYFYLSAASYPFIAVYNVSAALFRSQGNSKVSMFTALLMNIGNIGGNALFIYGFGMDVFGAGLSTLLSRVVGAVVLLWLLCRGSGLLAGESLRPMELEAATVGRILRVSVPSGVENSLFHVGKLMVQGLVASMGTMALAANAMANSLSSVVNIPGNAIGLALITVVGHCVGNGDYRAAHSYMLKLVGVAMAAALVMDSAFFFLAEPLTGFYGLSAETATLAARILRASSVAHALVWSLAFVLPNGLRAAGDVRFTMIGSGAIMWTCRIGLSYLFCGPMEMGLMGIWAAMFVDWAVRMVVFVWRFFSGRWQNRQVV